MSIFVIATITDYESTIFFGNSVEVRLGNFTVLMFSDVTKR